MDPAGYLDFTVGVAVGVTVAWVSAYIAIRRWSLVDVQRVMQIARYEALDTARRCVDRLVPPASERPTVNLKPGCVLPFVERPTSVYDRREADSVRESASDS